METPRQLRSAADERDDITIAHRDYEEENVLAIDFGPDVEAELDIVGGTAIVVAGDRQLEFDVPEAATEITTNDGVVIVKG